MKSCLNLCGKGLVCSLLLLVAIVVPNRLMAYTCSFSGTTLRITGGSSETLTMSVIDENLTSQQLGAMQTVYVNGFSRIEENTFRYFSSVKKIVVDFGSTISTVGNAAFGPYVEELEIYGKFKFDNKPDHLGSACNMFCELYLQEPAIRKMVWDDILPAGACRACKNLSSIPVITVKNIPENYTTFFDCTSLKDVYVDVSLSSMLDYYNEDKSFNQWFRDAERVHIVGEQKDTYSIAGYAFAKMPNLKEVYLPSQSCTVASNAFYGCENEITVKYDDAVETISYTDWWNSVKSNAGTMETVLIPNDDVACNVKIGESFPKAKKIILASAVSTLGTEFCRSSKSLEEIVIPKSVYAIGKYAFAGCENAKITFEESSVLNKSYSQTDNLMQAFYGVKNITIGANTTVAPYAFYSLNSLTNLILNEGVTIGDCAFGNTGVTELNLPKDITLDGSPFNTIKYLTFNSNKLLGDNSGSVSDVPNLFGNDVETIYFAKGVTSIGENSFAQIHSLKKVDIAGNVSHLGLNAFSGCSGLTEVVIGSGVTDINNSFEGCSNITNVTVNSDELMKWPYFIVANFPNAKKLTLGESVKHIGDYCCNGIQLEEIKLPSGLTTIGNSAFCNLYALGTIILPTTLRSIGENAFANCPNLNFTELPSSLTTIANNAFEGCTNITTLTFKNNSFVANGKFTAQDNIATRFPYLEEIIFPNVSQIPEYAFCGSNNLKSVTFNGVKVPTVASNAFCDCPNLTEVKYPFAESSISVDSWKAMNSLIAESQFQKLYVPNDKISYSEGLTIIKENLATLYPGIKEITFGAYVTRIGNNLMSYAENLEVVNIGNKVKNIDHWAFAHCPNLTTVNYQGDESQITINDEAFIGCPLIGQVSFHNWIASFPNPENVKELLIPNDNISDYEWNGLYNIATFFPNVEKVVFGPDVTRIHGNCLSGASKLKEVELNEGLKYIGLNAIYDSRLLTSITIPSTVEVMEDYAIVLSGQDVDVTFKTLDFIKSTSTNNKFVKIYPKTYSDENGENVPSHLSFNFDGVQTIPTYAFQNLVELTNVNLGSTALIGTCAFKGCTNLESIKIPESVTYLDKDAFAGMKGKVTLLGTNYRGGNFIDCFGNDVTEVVFGDNITNITFPANYSSLQKLTIGASAQTISDFSQCANLKSVTINSTSFATNANGGGWTKTSNLSSYFPYITEVNFEGFVQEIGANILYGNNTVETVNFGDNCNASVGASAFENCQQLKVVNGRMMSIGDNAFRGCSKLAKCEGTSYTQSLGVNAFQGCSSLESYNMHIGCNINTDESGKSNAFDGCDKLKNFIITGNQKEAEDAPSIDGLNFFGDVNLANATLVVDNYFYNAFQNAPVWKDFGNMGTTWYEVFADAVPYNSEYPNYQGEGLTYSRNFKNTEWQALYIPFSLAYEDWKDEVEIAYVNDVHQLDTDDDGQIDMTVLETIKIKSGVTNPNEPYIIRAKSVGKKEIHAGVQYVQPSEETMFDVSSRNTIFKFVGTYSGVSGAEMLEKGYYAFGGGSLIQADSEDANLLPCRWYMEVVDRNNNPKQSLGKVRLVVRGEDDTTDIKTLVMGNSVNAASNAIFDLSGRKVTNAQKGIYIKNGKKIVVR